MFKVTKSGLTYPQPKQDWMCYVSYHCKSRTYVLKELCFPPTPTRCYGKSFILSCVIMMQYFYYISFTASPGLVPQNYSNINRSETHDDCVSKVRPHWREAIQLWPVWEEIYPHTESDSPSVRLQKSSHYIMKGYFSKARHQHTMNILECMETVSIQKNKNKNHKSKLKLQGF